MNNKKDNMRICMIVVRGSTPSYGGGAIQCLNLCRGLKKHNVETLVITRGDHTAHDIDIRRLCSSYPEKIKRFIYPVTLFFYLMANHNKYDVLHVHGAYWLNFGAILAAKLSGKPVIMKTSMYGEDDPITIMRERFEFKRLGFLPYLSLKLSDRIISISSKISQAYKKSVFSRNKLVEIPNGVDLDRFSPLSEDEKKEKRKGLGLSAGGKMVSFSGSVSVRKGIDLLLKVWPGILEKHPDARLLIMGPIDTTADAGKASVGSAKDVIGEEAFDRSVILKGFLPQEEVMRHLQASDIFVLPSRKEGLPNALLEAMSCGLPSIATEIGGIKDIISDNTNGLLFEEDKEQEFSDKLKSVMEDDGLAKKLSMAARDTVKKRYSMEDIAVRYKGLYEELLKGRNVSARI